MDIKWNKHVVILYDKKRDKDIAAALKAYLESEFAPCDVIDVESDSFTPIINAKAREWSYRFCLKYARWILRLRSIREEKHHKKRIREERKEDKPKKDASLIIKSNPMVNRIINIIQRFDALMVICTTPESLKLSLYARTIIGKNFLIFGHITEFAVDKAFVRAEADGYFVENQECKKTLEKCGIAESKVVVAGVPLLENKKVADREEVLKKYGFSDSLPIVIVNGGDYETDTIREEIIALMKSREKYNMLVITGNDKVRRRYMNMPEFSAGVVFNEVFEKDMMQIADILITIPDSNVIFSAFASGVAVIITPYITVKERDVRKYLVKRALVLPVKNPPEMVAAIDELLIEPDRRQEFVERGISYASLSLKASINKKIALSSGMESNKI